MKTVDSSETITACDLKVGRCRQLIEIMKVRNDITTLALYGHGSEAILFFSMWQGKVIHFPIITLFYKHFLWDTLQ